MRHLLTLIALLFFASSAQAQRKQRPQPPPPLAVPTVYCELWRRESYSMGALSLDYGQEAPSLVQDTDLAEANDYISKLTSVAAALNYLYSRGWEVVSANDVPYDVDKTGTIENRVRYLLHRRTL